MRRRWAVAALACALAAPGASALAADGAGAVWRGADGFSADTAELVDAFDRAVPGDVRHGVVTVDNGGSEEVSVVLWAEARDGEAGDLLDVCRLRLTQGDEALFDGTLAAEGLSYPVPLGAVAPDGRVEVGFTLEVPEDAGNEHALGEGAVDLVVGASPAAGEPGTRGRSSDVPRTGDVARVAVPALGAAAAAVGAVLAVVRREGGRP